MRGLIVFWQSMLDKNLWLMDLNTRQMIRETIRCLKQAEKQSKLSHVEKEVEAIRMAHQR